jgi:hypothetical protein
MKPNAFSYSMMAGKSFTTLGKFGV